MLLSHYLQKEGLVTGPLFSSNTSHSSLENIKKLLLGQKLFAGGEQYLHFGSHLHLRFLKPSEKPEGVKLSTAELSTIDEMVDVLSRDKAVRILMADSICEEKFYVDIDGVKLAMILDIKQPKHKRGADLKTTACRSLADFIQKAKEYGYFRQAVTYSKGAKLKEFYFIGINKTKPYVVYLLNATDHKQELLYAEHELKFLLYFYKHYGKINPPSSGVVGEAPGAGKRNGKRVSKG